ncbi:MAG: molybdopterin biosynthesis protein, partial [Anaerolineales bacterium]
PLPAETVPLTEALGRVTAEPVFARLSSPHYHAAAMDGYAVRAADTQTATETRPVTLTREAQAVEVNTGAPLPAQANAVVMIEHVQHLPGGDISITAPVAPWQHVRMLGEDMVATELILPANHRLTPVDLGALAGCGHHTVNVRRAPRVAIIPTGSELVPASQAPQKGELIEYNSLVLSGQLRELGADVQVQGIAPDDEDALRAAIQSALSNKPDLLLVLSGSSAGSRDFTARLIEAEGELLVHGVAVRPGHPVIMGMLGTTPMIGVPGYPVSAALTGEVFIQPLIARWLGQPTPLDTRPRLRATLTRKLNSPPGDDDFARVTVAKVGERWLATPLTGGAGVITSLVRADGLAHIPRFSEGVDMGAEVDVILYRSPDDIARTVALMGSHDPMIDLLAQYLATAYPGERIASGHVGSMGGLVALRRGEAHLAGSHLLDPATGDYNLPYIRQRLPGTPVHVVTFARREQGLIVPPGNPRGVQSVDDLPGLNFVNRQPGAGTRLLLDYELGQRGIAPEDVPGYAHEEYTHLGVAAAVASGMADCGLGVRSAAAALGLDFISVGWERYDFIIPAEHLAHPGVGHLLDVLSSDTFKAALSAQPGYDAAHTGTIQQADTQE